MTEGTLFDAVTHYQGSPLTVVPLARETLAHLIRTLENLVLDRRLASLICTGVGPAQSWLPNEARLRALAGPAAYVLVFGEDTDQLVPAHGVVAVPLEPDEPLHHERFLLVLSYTFSAILCARPRADQLREPGAPSYDAVWSFDPPVVEAGLSWLSGYAAQRGHTNATEAIAAVRRVLSPHSTDVLALSQFTTEMIRFEEQLHQELTRVEQERTRVFEREALLSTIARAFIDLPSDQIDVAIDSALTAIGNFSGADRCLLVERAGPQSALHISYQWRSAGLRPLTLQSLPPAADGPGYELSPNDPIFVDDLRVVSSNDPLRDQLLAQGVVSLAAVPMVYRETLLGFVSLAANTPRHWNEEDRYLLETLMEIVVSALEHRRVERALGETESLLERVIYSTNHLVYVFSVMRDGSVVQNYSSPNIEHMLGYPPSVRLADGDTWTQRVVLPADRPSAILQLDRLRHGEDSEMEYRVIHADGRLLWVRDSARVEPGTGDVRWYCYGIISDITDRQAAELALRDRERLQMALEAERKVGELRNRFMLVVSHEFRTPLSIILTSSEMLDRYYDRMDADRRHERLSIIRAQVQHLRAMLDEISIMIRADLGRLEFRPAPTEVVEFTRQVAAEMAASVGVLHHVSVESDLTELHAQVDTTLLRHVLTNLLSNAIKFSEPETSVRLLLRLDQATHHRMALVFEVIDEGIGIEQGDLEHLFEPFFRGRNVGATSGTGLGLKVVRDCLTPHGGSVTAESTPGRGSRFVVTVPFEAVPRTDVALAAEPGAGQPPKLMTAGG